MRSLISILSAFLVLGFTANVASAGESEAVQTMAEVLVKLNHFPSDDEKQVLKQLTQEKETTADEKTVAQALLNVQHAVAAADKPKLEAILKDKKASASVKTLASAILSLNHKVSDSDKEKLEALIS